MELPCLRVVFVRPSFVANPDLSPAVLEKRGDRVNACRRTPRMMATNMGEPESLPVQHIDAIKCADPQVPILPFAHTEHPVATETSSVAGMVAEGSKLTLTPRPIADPAASRAHPECSFVIHPGGHDYRCMRSRRGAVYGLDGMEDTLFGNVSGNASGGHSHGPENTCAVDHCAAE